MLTTEAHPPLVGRLAMEIASRYEPNFRYLSEKLQLWGYWERSCGASTQCGCRTVRAPHGGDGVVSAERFIFSEKTVFVASIEAGRRRTVVKGAWVV